MSAVRIRYRPLAGGPTRKDGQRLLKADGCNTPTIDNSTRQDTLVMGGRQVKSAESIVDEFIDQVRAEMARQGISMSELARRAECGRPYLHRVLSREQCPTLDWAEKVAQVLGLTFTLEKIS